MDVRRVTHIARAVLIMPELKFERAWLASAFALVTGLPGANAPLAAISSPKDKTDLNSRGLVLDSNELIEVPMFQPFRGA